MSVEPGLTQPVSPSQPISSIYRAAERFAYTVPEDTVKTLLNVAQKTRSSCIGAVLLGFLFLAFGYFLPSLVTMGVERGLTKYTVGLLNPPIHGLWIASATFVLIGLYLWYQAFVCGNEARFQIAVMRLAIAIKRQKL